MGDMGIVNGIACVRYQEYIKTLGCGIHFQMPSLNGHLTLVEKDSFLQKHNKYCGKAG